MLPASPSFWSFTFTLALQTGLLFSRSVVPSHAMPMGAPIVPPSQGAAVVRNSVVKGMHIEADKFIRNGHKHRIIAGRCARAIVTSLSVHVVMQERTQPLVPRRQFCSLSSTHISRSGKHQCSCRHHKDLNFLRLLYTWVLFASRCTGAGPFGFWRGLLASRSRAKQKRAHDVGDHENYMNKLSDRGCGPSAAVPCRSACELPKPCMRPHVLFSGEQEDGRQSATQ